MWASWQVVIVSTACLVVGVGIGAWFASGAEYHRDDEE
jgi:ABC-type xylose transport system permease subunit